MVVKNNKNRILFHTMRVHPAEVAQYTMPRAFLRGFQKKLKLKLKRDGVDNLY
jgi:hypothetical protein